MDNDLSNIKNKKFLNRMKVFEEKFTFTNNKKFKPEIDYEKELVKRYQENSSILKRTKDSTKKIINDKLKREIKKLDEVKLSISSVNQKNIEIKNKIIINEQKVDDYITYKLLQAEKNLNEIYNEILASRKKNFITFDNRVNFYYKSNKSIRICKKKLYLLMNFLKLKIIDQRSLYDNPNELGLNESKVVNLGYFLNIEKNKLRPIHISSSLDEVPRTIYFWNKFCDYFKNDL